MKIVKNVFRFIIIPLILLYSISRIYFYFAELYYVESGNDGYYTNGTIFVSIILLLCPIIFLALIFLINRWFDKVESSKEGMKKIKKPNTKI